MVTKRTRREVSAPNVPPTADSLWVASKIKKQFSKICTPKAVVDLVTKYHFRKDGLDAHLDIIPCSPDEPCCFGKTDGHGRNFTYLFEILFSDLKYNLPFSDFTCSVLTLLNVAPTQLHGNAWAYLKAFEILCHTLHIEPTSNKFFYFFETYGRNVRGEYVSLATARGLGLFTLYKSHYKHFKGNFFKLRESELCKDIFYFDDGSPRFPFYWTNQYEVIIKNPDDALTPEELVDCRLLSGLGLNLKDFMDALSKNEVGKYIGKMARLTEEDILRFRREQHAAREKRNPGKSLTDHDTSHSDTKTGRPAKKKKKNDDPASVKNKALNQTSLEQFMSKGDAAETNKGCSSSAPPPCWKNLLKEFEELTSNEVTFTLGFQNRLQLFGGNESGF